MPMGFIMLEWLMMIFLVIGNCGAKKQDFGNPDSSCCNGNGSLDKKESVVCVEMGYYCFDILNSYLNNVAPPKTPCFTNDKYPLFITWKKGNDKELRGCIGTFQPLNLHDGLREFSLKSAKEDSRFKPIAKTEFKQLHVEVSLLRHFEDGKDYMDWELGTHGIRIEFKTDSGEQSTATFLPDVPPEQGWNQVETIDALLKKGGFKGTITDDVRKSIRLIRYQSEILNLSYSEYERHLEELKNQVVLAKFRWIQLHRAKASANEI